VSHAPRTIVGSLIVGLQATQAATRQIQIQIPSACARNSLFVNPMKQGKTNDLFNFVYFFNKNAEKHEKRN